MLFIRGIHGTAAWIRCGVFEHKDPPKDGWFIPVHSGSDTPLLGSGRVLQHAGGGGGICSLLLGGAEPWAEAMEVLSVSVVQRNCCIPPVPASEPEAGGECCSLLLGTAEPWAESMEVLSIWANTKMATHLWHSDCC